MGYKPQWNTQNAFELKERLQQQQQHGNSNNINDTKQTNNRIRIIDRQRRSFSMFEM